MTGFVKGPRAIANSTVPVQQWLNTGCGVKVTRCKANDRLRETSKHDGYRYGASAAVAQYRVQVT